MLISCTLNSEIKPEALVRGIGYYYTQTWAAMPGGDASPLEFVWRDRPSWGFECYFSGCVK